MVDVRYTPSVSQPRGKLFGLIFTFAILILFTCAALFMPGKHGSPSMWHDLSSDSTDSSTFLFSAVLLAIFLGFFSWQWFRYARAAWASDETFHCDRHVLVVSRVPWLDFSNRVWRTQTYPLTEVGAIRFAVIASTKGKQIWGLHFQANDGSRWALPGIGAPEAKTILQGLKALGANVPEDPNLDKRIKDALKTRFGDSTWMDRSWMDSSKG